MIYLLICMFMTPVLFPLVIIIVRIVEVKRDPFIHIRGKVNLARDWEIGEEQKRAIRLYRSALGELEKRFGQDLRTDPSESDDKKIAETRDLFEELTRKTQLFDRGKKGEGVLINAKGKTRIEFEYEIDGRKYTAEVKKPFGLLENGEIYEILYLPENPLMVHLMFYKPVFVRKKFKTTRVQSIDDRGEFYSFFYKVSGKEYKRNFLKSKALSNNNGLDPDNYKVLYDKENPKIAYPTPSRRI